MNHTTIARIAFAVAVLTAAGTSAFAVTIELKSAQYRTFVARGELSGAPFETRTNFSSAPIGDAYLSPDAPGWVECQADATLFDVFTSAQAAEREIYRGHAEAFAGAEFTFAALQNTLAPIELHFSMLGQFAWGGNEVSLFDLTTGDQVWSFYDHGLSGGNIPWNFFEQELDAGVTASLLLPTQLFAAHDYQFTMCSWGSSSVPDTDTRHVQICGLELGQPVPEPAVGALTLLAAGWFLRRKRS